MAQFVELSTNLKELRKIDSRLVSYNIEMTEVTGGTFWKAYTPEQVDGAEEFPFIEDWTNLKNLQQYYEPIDLSNPKLRMLAKALGPAWVRVSGTWANKTYYDFDGHTNGQVPEGYQNLLTEAQWKGVLDFVKVVDGKLLVSVANCPGNHSAEEPWDPAQMKLLFDYSRNYGVPIRAAEFTNEPNALELSGLPKGYTGEQFSRDHDLFVKYMRENYPEVILVGPCTVGDAALGPSYKDENASPGLSPNLRILTTDGLIASCTENLDVFSYHYYNGVSERGAAMGGHWQADQTFTEKYLALAGDCARVYSPLRDKYVPNGQMWVTESGDAGGGGNTWASTYMDVPRTLNELGEFPTITDGIIFHNTFASSDYGYLQHTTFDPRPNYFAVLLWNRLMGEVVYDTGLPVVEGAHVYAHSRKDGKEGLVYLVINNSLTEETIVSIPKEAEIYVLGAEKIRSRVMQLNGKDLMLENQNVLPNLEGKTIAAGNLVLAPATCTFIVL